MKATPIRYSADVEATTRFFTALGLDVDAVSRPGSWVELAADAGTVAVHRAAPGDEGRCELAFEADEPLEAVAERLRAAGFDPGPVIDESHGRSIRVQDPDGVWVQINRNDRRLFT
ncbi:VOC family protein [Glycomyces harbinensis]|uniref:VOC domain-containing protein n=1 Tax=Glycomyces harbinensis TaxID=58114 RepID=A0A1G6UC97_9ACTN|nr:VOC family protein [Glycomyces harbinensis]SDD39010.1 hypothetical protein SAMN05216270_103425 [Glycomyces harbinensis]